MRAKAAAAGTDLQLTYSAMTGDFADTNNASVVKQLRQATKNVLYTTVNSNMMQGMAPGSVARYGTATWQYAVYGVTATLVAIAAVLVFFGLRVQAAGANHLGIGGSLPAICFPTAATVANSWNPKLGEALGEALGEEALAQKVDVVLGPGLNIKRNPLCGRNFEYFSEDPLLAGKMAAGYVEGHPIQGGLCLP